MNSFTSKRRTTRSPAYRLLAALFVPVLLLTGCSSTTFFYNRLDLVLPWYLGRYVDLDREQGRQLDRRLEGLLAWHRREELPAYAALIADFERLLEEDLSAEQIAAFTRDAEEAWYRTRDRGLSELLALGATLDEEQIEEFLENMDKRQRKYERKYLRRSDAEYREEAEEELEDFLDDYLGRLAAVQRDAVVRCVADLRRSDSYWLRERAEWTEVMRGELAREDGWQERTEQLIRDWESQLDEETREVYEHNTQRVQQLVAEVINLRSAKQDRRLRERLRDYREDFIQLAAQAPAPDEGQAASAGDR